MDRKALGAILVAMALSSTGCGGSKPLTHAELVKRTGTVCKQLYADGIAVLHAHPNHDATQRVDLNHVGQRAIRELRQLSPPKDVSATYDRYVAALRGAIDAMTSAHSQAPAVRRRQQQQTRLAGSLARSLGLFSCGA